MYYQRKDVAISARPHTDVLFESALIVAKMQERHKQIVLLSIKHKLLTYFYKLEFLETTFH